MTQRLAPGRLAKTTSAIGALLLVGLLLPGLAWSDPDPENPLPAAQIHFQQGDLVAIGSVPPSEWDPYGSQTPQVDYDSLVAGGYKDKVVEVDCRPFSFEQFADGTYRYFAYGTDDTGFGWREGEPILLVSPKPLNLSDRDGTLDAVAVPSGVERVDLFNGETGDAKEFEVPVLEVVDDAD